MAAMVRLATAALVVAAAVLAGAADEPYKKMLDDELSFTGTESLPVAGTSREAIVIGLFSPDDDDHPVGRALTRGVTLAVEQANAAGGIGDRPVRLVRRWADDPWGAGSNEVVRLVFEDRAWAVIGGPDSASTHIAQQVATKAHIPLIAPVSSDPSLTHTRVPWIFRLPPDDAAQAALLVDRGILPRGLGRIGLVTSTDHDSRTAAIELLGALETSGKPAVFHLEVTTGVAGPIEAAASAAFPDLVRRIADFEPDGLVIRLPAGPLRDLAAFLDSAGLEIPIFLPWVPGLDLSEFPLQHRGDVQFLTPFDTPRACGPALKFIRSYIARFGDRPTPVSTYGHEAASMVIESARRGAAGRVELRTGIADLSGWTGAAGTVSWDSGGGNTAPPQLHLEEDRELRTARESGTAHH